METSPYLKDPAEREAWIVLTVASSSAIEGISRSAFSAFPAAQKSLSRKAGFAAATSVRSPRRKSSLSVRSSH